MANSRSVSAKTKPKRTAQNNKGRGSSWPSNSVLQNHILPLLFIAVFALIGGILTLLLTQAASKGSPIVGVAGKCLDNAANKKVNGNKIQLYTCNSTAAQQWSVTTMSDGTSTITNANGYCLDVKDQGAVPRTIVQLYTCDGTVAQKWIVKSNGQIINPIAGLCLDDKYSGTTNGNQIWMWQCNGTGAQQWSVQDTGTTPPPSTGGGSGGGSSTGSGSGGSGNGGGNASIEPSGQAMPTGNINGWKQTFADNFSGAVPVGAFSDCNHNTDTPQAYCNGLKPYGNYFANWWAYPTGWPDTAKAGADGNPKAPANSPGGKTEVGGQYHPEDTVSIGDGAMHIRMFRPNSGRQENHVATLVPRPCMDQKYGRYVERFKVVHADPGFKSAHLFYDNGYEIDYPESDSYSDPFSAFTHYTPPNSNNSYTTSHSAGTGWTDWHTTVIEWTSSSIKFYVDGKIIGSTSSNIPNIKLSWVLQNESSILGPKFATPGNYAQLDLDWVACYSKS